MRDPRIQTLAETLVDHSLKLKTGDKVLIEGFDLPDEELICRLVELVAVRGGLPLVSWKSNRILRSLYQTGTDTSLGLMGQMEKHCMQQMDCYIGIRGAENLSQFSDVGSEQMERFQKHVWKAVHLDVRVPKTRWVVLRYPNASMAQSAKMSTEAFEDFYFNVCTTDYARMAENQRPLAKRMLACDQVKITAPGTDLTFSIKEIPVVPCNGARNIPDGEVFTAPVKNSINGTITFNTPSLYHGTIFEGVRFTFQEGKIVEAECKGETEKLNKILDSDEGARYCGEWAVGCNNQILEPMLDTLFDEKIGGSFHLTPGNAYETADNGNRSGVHWDLVLIQRPEYGGGEMWFDGELIRKDGKFVPADLQPLNEGL